MSVLFYKKPEYSNKEGDLSQSSCQKYVERAACSRAAIPDELSFKNVIEDKTLPPCSLQDFLDYLIYVSHDAENLQFYLWYRDYCKRFNMAPGWKRAMSPLWSDGIDRNRPHNTDLKRPAASQTALTSPIASPMPQLQAKPLPLPPSPMVQFGNFSFDDHKELAVRNSTIRTSSETLGSDTTAAQDVTDNISEVSVDEKTKSHQPFREEVEQIANHYLRHGAPRELNLSSRERRSVLRAIELTTHPSAFLEVARLTETTLRYHSHRNFVRWSICNGNKPRVFVLRSIAIFALMCVLALSFTLILSSYSRWLRLCIIPVLYFASVNLIAARQGLCVLLHRRKHREARPWEIDEYMDDNVRANMPASLEEGRSTRNLKQKMAFLGPKNDFQSEPWVKRWQKRNAWQRIRVQKIRVGPGGLRMVQDRILWQAEAWGLIVTLVIAGAICAFPVFRLY